MGKKFGLSFTKWAQGDFASKMKFLCHQINEIGFSRTVDGNIF